MGLVSLQEEISEFSSECGDSEKGAICTLRGEIASETELISTLMWVFQLPKL